MSANTNVAIAVNNNNFAEQLSKRFLATAEQFRNAQKTVYEKSVCHRVGPNNQVTTREVYIRKEPPIRLC